MCNHGHTFGGSSKFVFLISLIYTPTVYSNVSKGSNSVTAQHVSRWWIRDIFFWGGGGSGFNENNLTVDNREYSVW
jgi:hypothetical protein